jgi:hypothetical protein
MRHLISNGTSVRRPSLSASAALTTSWLASKEKKRASTIQHRRRKIQLLYVLRNAGGPRKFLLKSLLWTDDPSFVRPHRARSGVRDGGKERVGLHYNHLLYECGGLKNCFSMLLLASKGRSSSLMTWRGELQLMTQVTSRPLPCSDAVESSTNCLFDRIGPCGLGCTKE